MDEILSKSLISVNKNSSRLYLEDVKRIHRKEIKRQSRQRSATGEKKERYNYSYVLSMLQLMKLIMFQTYMGDEPKFTCREWLVEDLNNLRSDSEKKMAVRSIQRPLNLLSKIVVDGIPLITKTVQKGRYITDDNEVRYKTHGMQIEIPCIQNMVKYFALILTNYHYNLRPDLPREEIRKKVMGQIKDFFLRIPSENSRKMVDLIALLPVDNLFMWTNLRWVGDLFALHVGLNCALYTNTHTNTYQIQYIPSPDGSGVSFSSLDLRISEGGIESDESGGGDVGDVLSGLVNSFKSTFAGLSSEQECHRDWRTGRVNGISQESGGGGQRGDVAVVLGTGDLDVDYDAVPDVIRKAVSTKMKEHENRFKPIKSDISRFRKAHRDMCATAISALKGDLNANKAQIMGAAAMAVSDYLRKAEEFGFDIPPEIYRPPDLQGGDPTVAKNYLEILKGRLRFD